jgi:hypothetical protein
VGDGDFGFGISDCGFETANPQSEIRNPKFERQAMIGS